MPVYETFRCQSVTGRSFVDGCWQRYKQAKRHCLGHIDLGYVCWKGWTKVHMPFRFRFIAAIQVARRLPRPVLALNPLQPRPAPRATPLALAPHFTARRTAATLQAAGGWATWVLLFSKR